MKRESCLSLISSITALVDNQKRFDKSCSACKGCQKCLKQLQTVQKYWFHFWLLWLWWWWWYSLINYTAQDSWTVKTTCMHHFRNMVKQTKRWKIPKTDSVGGVEGFHRHDQLMHLPPGPTHPLLFTCVSISRILISLITNFLSDHIHNNKFSLGLYP